MSGEVFSTSQQRGFLKVSGPDCRSWLQGLISNDIHLVTPDRSIHAALLTPQGKFLFHMFCYAVDDGILIETSEQRAGELLHRLLLYKLRADVAIEDVADAHAFWLAWPIATTMQHPDLPTQAGQTQSFEGSIIAVDPRLADLGLRIVSPAGTMPALPFAVGGSTIQSYRTHQAKLGVFDPERDLAVQQTTLLEANFDKLNGVDFEKGCYVGQELTARMHYRALIRKRQLSVHFQGDGETRAGDAILDGGLEIGKVLSCTGDFGLALVRLDRLEASKRDHLTAGARRVRIARPGFLDQQ